MSGNATYRARSLDEPNRAAFQIFLIDYSRAQTARNSTGGESLRARRSASRAARGSNWAARAHCAWARKSARKHDRTANALIPHARLWGVAACAQTLRGRHGRVRPSKLLGVGVSEGDFPIHTRLLPIKTDHQ
jgi:hypothetical protein